MIRNLNTRRFNKSKTKSNRISLDLLNEGLFYGLVFFDKSKDIVLNTERLIPKPTVTINGNDIFFDYSNYKESSVNILKLKFKYAQSGDIFTVTNGSYENPVEYIDDVNITGTYIFQEMLNKTIIKAKINSAPDVGTVTLFNSPYFTSAPQLQLSDSIRGDLKVFGVKNLLGSSTKNSILSLGLNINDQVKFNSQLNTKTFTIKDFYKINNVEYLFFDDDCVSENNFSESIYIEHYREKVESTLLNSKTTETSAREPSSLPDQEISLTRTTAPIAQETGRKTGPFAVDGYYPLYTTAEGAIEASPSPSLVRNGETTEGYHTHEIQGKTFYMPNGLVENKTFFHGNYSTFSQSAIYRSRSRVPDPVTPIVPRNPRATSQSTPPPPPPASNSTPRSSPASAPSSSSGYGY